MHSQKHELIFTCNEDISNRYELIAAYITGVFPYIDCDEDYDEGLDFFYMKLLNGYSIGDNVVSETESRYSRIYHPLSFFDKSFPHILFPFHTSDDEAVALIKQELFKKFNTEIALDDLSLIDEAIVRLESNAFNEIYTREYCNQVKSDFDMLNICFSRFKLDKEYLPLSKSDKTYMFSIEFKNEPTQDIIDEMVHRFNHFVENFPSIIASKFPHLSGLFDEDSKVDDKYFYSYPSSVEYMTKTLRIVDLKVDTYTTYKETKKFSF